MIKPDDTEQEYWDRWNASRDKHAADALLQIYMPLVQYHVQRISVGLPKNVDRSELQSYGMIGLYDALEKFDRNRYLKFDTYASFRVRGAILDGLRKEDWMPRSVREKSKRIERASEQIEQEQKRSASLEEVANKCKMSVEEVSQVVSDGLLTNLLSLDDGTSPGSSDYLQGAIEDEAASRPDQRLIKKEENQALAKEIDRLSTKERTVISLFYYDGLTLTEIGQVLSLSTSRISQIHSKALFKLRQFLSESRI